MAAFAVEQVVKHSFCVSAFSVQVDGGGGEWAGERQRRKGGEVMRKGEQESKRERDVDRETCAFSSIAG